MRIGNRLKYLRTLKKLSLAELGKGIVSPTHLSNIENGRFNPSDDILSSISGKLKVELSYLTNHDKFDPVIQKSLDELLNSLIINSVESKLIIDILSETVINNILQETIYLMLVTCYKYKNNLIAENEQNQLSFYEIDSINLTDPLLTKSYYYYQGQIHFYQGDYKKSLVFFDKLIKITHSEHVNLFLLYNLALLEYRSGFYIRAAKSTEKALDKSLKTHNWEVSLDLYNLLTVICWKSRDTELAKNYAFKALEIGQIHNSQECHRVYHNLGCIILEEGVVEEAISFLKKAIVFKEKIGVKTFSSKRKLLNCYLSLSDENNFKALFNELVDLIKTEKENIILRYYNAIYLKEFGLGDYISILEELVPLLKTNDLTKEYSYCLKELSKHYEEKKYYKISLSYYQKQFR